MKFYKVLFLIILLLSCINSICAVDTDNSTGDGGLNSVNHSTVVSNESVGHLMPDKEKFEFMSEIYRNNTSLNKKVKTLNDTLNLVLEDNKALNNKSDALNVEIKQVYKEKDKGKDRLNAERDKLYEKLLSSPAPEEVKLLKAELKKKDAKIEELNKKIDKLDKENKQLTNKKTTKKNPNKKKPHRKG